MRDFSELNKLTYKIRGYIFEVYKTLGPGLLEVVYRQAMMQELKLQGINARQEVSIPVVYKGVDLGLNYRMDILVEDTVILELKSVEKLHPVFFKQLTNYLKLTHVPLGLLINFNTTDVAKEIHRIAN